VSRPRSELLQAQSPDFLRRALELDGSVGLMGLRGLGRLRAMRRPIERV
jgi:hypothetical protein